MPSWKEIEDRLTVGGSTYMTAIGGLVSFAAWGLAFALALMGDSRNELITAIVVGFISGVVVVYDCGHRLIKAERKTKVDAELGVFMGMMLTRINEIDGMPAETYRLHIDPFGADPRMDAVLWYIKDRLPISVGPANTALFYDTTGMKHTPVDSSHPFKTIEVFRLKNLDILRHHVAQLSEIIRRCT